MSLMSAMNTAVSGLDAQAAQLSSISNNIANSSTVGYKESDTDFESLVLSGTSDSAATLGGVSTRSVMSIGVAGQAQTTGVSTDIAVNGSGLLIVGDQAANGTGQQYLATRAGSFRPDAAGNLVNAGGYYLQGLPLDAAGNPAAAAGAQGVQGLSTVNIAYLSAAAAPTTAMTFNANLPAAAAQATAGAAAATTTESYYDALGNSQSLKLTFTPSATVPDAWALTVTDSATTGTAPVAAATLNFNPTGANAGQLATTTNGTGYDPATGILTVPTGNGTGSIALSIGKPDASPGMQQLSGAYTVTSVANNGSGFGLLQGVSIGTTGQVVASFSNGSTRPIYQLQLATFANEDGLAAVSGGAYAMTPAAGVPLLSDPGSGSAGTTVGGSLEGSNVDLPTQLTNLIETQRAYSSAGTVVQAANQMMQTAEQLNH